MKTSTRKICYTALMIAVTFIMISVVKIPIPNGYIHLGDAAVFLSAFILGPVWGSLAAALGAAAADYFAGFGAYIIPSFIAKGAMALLTGYFLNQRSTRKTQFAIMGLAGILMTLIYYISEVFLYGSFSSPLINIPFNLLQVFVGIVIAMLLFKPLQQFQYHC